MKCGVPTARCAVELPRANHERLCRGGGEHAAREMRPGGSYQADGAAHVHDLVRIEEVIEGAGVKALRKLENLQGGGGEGQVNKCVGDDLEGRGTAH
jgi:hypothetical protein